MVSVLIFRLLIDSELTFVHMWDKGSSSLFCVWIFSCLGTTIPSTLSDLGALDKNPQAMMYGWFLDFQFYSIGLNIYSYASTTLFRSLCPCSKFWNWEGWVLQLCSFFQNCVGYLEPLIVPYESDELINHFCKRKDHLSFDRGCTESAMLTILSILIHEYGMFFIYLGLLKFLSEIKTVLQFPLHKSSTYLVDFIPRYFILWMLL